jgi:transposase-like protein
MLSWFETPVPVTWHINFDSDREETMETTYRCRQHVLSLTAKGLTSGEVSAHIAEIYDSPVSKETIWRITGGMAKPAARSHLRGDLHKPCTRKDT